MEQSKTLITNLCCLSLNIQFAVCWWEGCVFIVKHLIESNWTKQYYLSWKILSGKTSYNTKLCLSIRPGPLCSFKKSTYKVPPVLTRCLQHVGSTGETASWKKTWCINHIYNWPFTADAGANSYYTIPKRDKRCYQMII